MEAPYRYVTSAGQLQEAAEHLARAPVVGVDTEADSFFSYAEKVCLVQLTGGGQDYIIDPLQVRDLSPLGPVFADRQVVKVFHGADYDVVSLKRDFGFEIRNLFDTMVAAQAVGIERFSLADLVQREFGVTLDKRYQRHDWSRRPLLSEHLDYARLDSHFLPELRDRMAALVEEKGRAHQVGEEFELLEQRQWTGRTADPDAWTRVKGVQKLRPEHQVVARELFRLRDRIARELDRPAFKVMGNDLLLVLARTRPQSRADLRDLLGDRHSLVRRHGADVIEAVLAASQSQEPLARPARRGHGLGGRGFTREDDRLFERLKSWRNDTAAALGIGPAMVVPSHLLKALAQARPRTHSDLEAIPDIRRWQVRDFGEPLLRVIAEGPDGGQGSGVRSNGTSPGSASST